MRIYIAILFFSFIVGWFRDACKAKGQEDGERQPNSCVQNGVGGGTKPQCRKAQRGKKATQRHACYTENVYE